MPESSPDMLRTQPMSSILHSLRGAVCALLTAMLAVGLLTGASLAQPGDDDLTRQTAVWKEQLDVTDREIKATQPPTESFLSKVATDLEHIGIETARFIEQHSPAAAAAKTLLDKLGEAPKEGAPPEADEIAQQRRDLTERFARIDGAIRSAASLREQALQLREAVVSTRRDLFVTEILRKSQSPFSLALWREGIPDFGDAYRRLSGHAQAWAKHNRLDHLALMLAGTTVLAIVLQLIMGRFIHFYRATPEIARLPFFRQAASAAIVALLRALPLVLATIALFVALTIADMLSFPFDELVPIAFIAFSAVVAIRALSMTLLAPNHPQWRILPVSSPNARRLNRLLFAIAGVYGADLFLDFLNKTLHMPLSLTVVQSAVASVIFGGLLAAVLRTPFRAHAIGGSNGSLQVIRLFRLPLWFVFYAVMAATALGYISLARFLTQQTVVTGYILIIVYLGHLAINEFTDSFGDANSASGRFLRTTMSMATQRREQLGAVATLVLNAVLIVTTLPFLALQWGFSWSDVSSWLQKLVFGFEFGGLEISLISLFVALLLFLAGLVVTRIFQSWLDARILSKSHSQTGAEHSIKTAVGYLGIVVSALIAVSYTGIGFSNIAIVAGALSVGIGFGLQSIVNNFVSGLILLAERPIKVGDWIIVGNDEGYVRQISVRSTEIETFDRAHIIVPNSELISGTVKNWTLRGPLGRISIRIGVSYEADSRQVHDLLLDIARHHPSVLEYPAPFVVFEDFGESSLDFTLRAYISDINTSLSVRTALRHEIFRRFKESGIEIPYRQTDLHLRNLDELARIIAGLRQEATPATPQEQPVSGQENPSEGA